MSERVSNIDKFRDYDSVQSSADSRYIPCRYEDVVELLLKNGARVDVEARMCWPGSHQSNCEERGRQSRLRAMGVGAEKHDSGGTGRNTDFYRGSDKLQCAIYYAIDGDQVDILELLAQQGEDHWLPW